MNHSNDEFRTQSLERLTRLTHENREHTAASDKV